MQVFGLMASHGLADKYKGPNLSSNYPEICSGLSRKMLAMLIYFKIIN